MSELRTNWSVDEIEALYQLPFMDLLLQAQTTHRQHFKANEIQIAHLLSIKTGACPEDCGYCSQSGHHSTSLKTEKLLPLDEVIEKAKAAKASGSTRFCMGGAWRSPPKKAMGQLCDMIKAVNELGMESCLTAGMLDDEDVAELEAAGLRFYNHNLDTSPEYYDKVTKTRTYQDRLDTLERVRQSKISVCCGGILGLGEAHEDRASLLQQLANQPEHPASVPINMLIAVPGTPMGNREPIDELEFVRTIAVARILMPKSVIRLSAGRDKMSDSMQALCFMAGASSIFVGETLLTCGNPSVEKDQSLLQQLGIHAQVAA